MKDHASALFQSDYLRAADLQDQPRRVTIESCAPEKFGNDQIKPVLKFRGVPKGLVVNKTNSMLLAAAFGPETNNWIGREIELATEMVMYQGRAVPGIRARVPAISAPPPGPPQVQPTQQPVADASPSEPQQQAAPDPQAPAQEKVN